MASLVQCITDLLAAGRITPEQADAITRDAQRATTAFELSGYPRGQAEQKAAASALRTHKAGIAQRRRQTALQMIAQAQADTATKAHPRGRTQGIFALLDRDVDPRSQIVSVTTRAGALENLLHSKLTEFMAAARTTRLGLAQDRALMRRVVAERFNKSTGDAAAKAYSDAIGQALEFTRQMFNRAGGAIAKLEGYGMPQVHDPRLVARAGREKWINDIMQGLDRDRMLGPDMAPMSTPELRMLLESTYDKISTDGLIDLVPGQIGGSKLANTRQDHRFLHFKDADAWLAYHDQYGSRDLFATVMSHLSGMANDIALMERFGPNPDGTFRYLRDLSLREGDLKPGSLTDSRLQATWNVVSGKTGASTNPARAEAFTAVRNFLVSTRLGSAALSAVTDISFVRQTAAWNGLSTTRFTKELVKQLMEMPAGDRQRMAVRMGAGAEAWVTKGLAANRFTDVTGLGKTAILADLTMRASGLSRFTDAELKAWGMMVMGELGERVGKSLDQLEPDLAAGMRKFGIDEQAWDEIRAIPLFEPSPGVGYVNVENILAHDVLPEARRLELARKVLDFMYETSHIAVPHPSAAERAFTTLGMPRGSYRGELWRSVAQFKSFPLTIIMTHARRGLYVQGNAKRARYYAGLIVTTTAMGALALQLKDISKGRDPRAMDSADFWGSALLQGGGAGLYGDFLYAGLFGQSRFGRGLSEELAGPMAGMASDLVQLSFGNTGQALTGQDPKFVSEAIRFGAQNVPFLSSGWYTRLAFERMVTDELRMLSDDNAWRGMAKAVNARKKEYNQDYWWRPGAAAPQRGPDLEAALGD